MQKDQRSSLFRLKLKIIESNWPYKSLPVEAKVGLFLGLISRISPALPKTRVTISYMEGIFRPDLYRSSRDVTRYCPNDKTGSYQEIPLQVSFVQKDVF